MFLSELRDERTGERDLSLFQLPAELSLLGVSVAYLVDLPIVRFSAIPPLSRMRTPRRYPATLEETRRAVNELKCRKAFKGCCINAKMLKARNPRATVVALVPFATQRSPGPTGD